VYDETATSAHPHVMAHLADADAAGVEPATPATPAAPVTPAM
jgi:hypothetical protein